MADDYRRQGFELERRIFELDIKCSSLRAEKQGTDKTLLLLFCLVAILGTSYVVQFVSQLAS